MKATDWAYLAGVLDSDGCISIAKQTKKGRTYHRLTVTITNTNRDLVDWLVTNFEGSCYMCNPNAPKHHKTAWRWIIRGHDARPILNQTLPYLMVKRKRAELALQFVKTIRSRGESLTDKERKQRERLHAILRSMNTAGRLR
jgi:hypothetical protein